MIKYLFLDIDGTLTDGKIYIGNDGECMKAFSIKDGYAFSYVLKPAGIVPVVITGRKSQIVQNRCNELKITEIYQGVLNKYEKIVEIVGEENLGKCAYFGDDLIDYESMKEIKKRGGIVGCPADAVDAVCKLANFVCKHKAGDGAMREFAEMLADLAQKEIVKSRVDMAFDYIWNLDKTGLRQGKYIVNEWFYYSVQEYDTRDRGDCVLESHRKYLDIQWVVSGEEIIEITNGDGLEVEKAYSEADDRILHKTVDGMNRFLMVPGSCVVIYPNNAHMGCIKVNEKSHIVKIVGKVDCLSFYYRG